MNPTLTAQPLLTPEHQTAWSAALDLAQSCEVDARHAQQVTRLSLRLFDLLTQLHQLGSQERFWLQCAAVLHDIGWLEGWKGHHKATLQIILNTHLLPFDARTRLIVGSIARYHRRALPSQKHDHYAALAPAEQHVVGQLAAILRIADGLDRLHQNTIADLEVQIGEKKVTLRCGVLTRPAAEAEAALDKADLFEQVFNRKVKLVWKLVS
ncbi:MAG TPA: HD domain-containing protein [Anaerolineaceae bacterium]|nr:HD domain-containing protein [Anaerolineaceae bacterium]